MKKAYNETWVENLDIQQVAKTWLQKNLLSHEQFETIKTQFPEDFYHPNIFIRIGLFIFGVIGCSFLSAILLPFLGNLKTAMSIVCAICFIFALEFIIRERKVFHSGIDNALLYAAIGAVLFSAFGYLHDLQNWQYCLISFIVFAMATWRYADVFTAVATHFTFLAFVTTYLIQFPSSKALLPFALMLLSALIYYFNKKKTYSYYTDCQSVIEISTLITFYLSGNYFIVREGNTIMLNDLAKNPPPQIDFAALFYIITALIPIIFIIGGLHRKNRKLLIIGLSAVGFSIFSYRYYFSILAIEWALILGGILLISIAIFATKYLKNPKYGISDDENEGKISNLGSIIISQTIMQNITAPEKGLEFGGGETGGGGAGGGID